ncbi:hypothetical protein [Alteromonas sp. BMJM2]|uniref:hypothetical protein n=1 Tax=Alteromonas sp. BMJM2 TaxID=2954241 RepID=UPI0022B58E06|nr:hypothetical protein [Alteromonas sp. BMJM2]
MYSIFTAEDFKGINLQQCLSADAYYLKRVKSEKGLRERLDMAYRNLVRSDFTFNGIQNNKSCEYLCFRGLVRDDYRYFFNQVIQQISGEVIVVEDYHKETNSINLDLVSFVNENRHLMHLINENNAIRKLCLYLNLCSYLIVLDNLRAINFKVLVVFADMQPVDNLLVQYFRNRDVKTVTLQHGLYVEYKDYDTVNIVNYEQQCAQYFLAWGECTGKLIKDYHPETQVVLCGKPELSIAKSYETSELESNYVLVVLDQPIFDEQNFEMIDIALNYGRLKGFDVKVRFHPQNDRSKYLCKFPGLVEGSDLGSSRLIIGHTSTLLFEAIVMGMNVMRFKTDIPCLPTPDELQFSNLDELKVNATGKSVSNEVSNYYIAKTKSASFEKYKKFFDSLT